MESREQARFSMMGFAELWNRMEGSDERQSTMTKQPKLPTESDLQVFCRNGWLIFLVSVHGLAGLFFPLFLRRAESGDVVSFFICAAILGGIASQFMILGFLFALFPAGLMMRLSMVIGLVAVSICMVVFGNHLFDGTVTFWLETYLSWVPILVAGWTVPFIVASAFFGWSLRFEFDHHSEGRRMSVSSLLIGTALIACCLALLKTGSAVRVAPAIATSIACMGGGLVFAIPITLMVLTESRLPRKLLTGLAISFGPALILVGVYLVSGAGDWKPVLGVIAMVCMLISYCAFLIGIGFLGLKFSSRTGHVNF